jgi:hypothetical protein
MSRDLTTSPVLRALVVQSPFNDSMTFSEKRARPGGRPIGVRDILILILSSSSKHFSVYDGALRLTDYRHMFFAQRKHSAYCSPHIRSVWNETGLRQQISCQENISSNFLLLLNKWGMSALQSNDRYPIRIQRT